MLIHCMTKSYRYRFRKGITYKAYKVFKRFLRRDYLQCLDSYPLSREFEKKLSEIFFSRFQGAFFQILLKGDNKKKIF